MGEHTKGPWRIGDAGATVFGPPSAEPSPVIIATLPKGTSRVAMDERKVNARLIASAPDLLAALVDMLGTFNNSGKREDGRTTFEIVENALAIVAKVEGRQ